MRRPVSGFVVNAIDGTVHHIYILLDCKCGIPLEGSDNKRMDLVPDVKTKCIHNPNYKPNYHLIFRLPFEIVRLG